LIVSLYVDDLIFIGNSWTICEELKHSMQFEFDMTDLGKMYFIKLTNNTHQTQSQNTEKKGHE